ncbi:MAG: hypothetical protein V4692_12635 [Bdellovibrionota bacterium]
MKSVIAAFVAAATVLTATSAFAETIKSRRVSVNAARITDRIVLADKNGERAVLVQILAEKTNGSTDVSNTHRLILSISQIGEMSETEASFVLTKSMGIQSATRLEGGRYQIVFMEASSENPGFLETRIIDARDAVSSVQDSKCGEFSVCRLRTTVQLDAAN